MAEYFEKEVLIWEIIFDMALFMGEPDAVQEHDERCNYAISCIENAPPADVAPVRHGRWYDKGALSCRCSECGCKSNRESNYCPNCGALMKEAEHEVG